MVHHDPNTLNPIGLSSRKSRNSSKKRTKLEKTQRKKETIKQQQQHHQHLRSLNTFRTRRLQAFKMAQPLGMIYKYAIPIAFGVSFVQASIYDVKGGTRAVIFDRLSGVQEKVVNEGTHFLVPWLQRSIIYDVRTKPRNISTTTGSKDLQMVSLTLRVLHRPEVQKLPKIYQV